MLEFIRRNQRLCQIVLLIFIVPSFALLGVEGYSRFSGGDGVAKVAGQKVTQQDWDRAIRERVEIIRKQYPDQADQKIFDSADFKNGVLEGLLIQKALEAEAVSQNVTVSDATLRRIIQQQFPNFRTPDGKFDSAKFKEVLEKNRGMSEETFVALLRQDMMIQRLRSGILLGTLTPKSVGENILNALSQEREIQWMQISAANYMSKSNPTDEAISDFYAKNQKLFEIPEQIKAEYVVLTQDAVAAGIKVSEDDAQSYYKQNADRFNEPEKRAVSHILIATDAKAAEEEKNAAKAKAEELAKQARKTPSDFAKLAKANSQDDTAANGGSLGLLTKQTQTKLPLDKIFSMKKGEISDPVQTDAGYHIITVTDITPEKKHTYADVKDKLIAEIKQQLVAKKMSESVEEFTNLVYEQFDSLKAVSDKFNLKIEKVDLLRQPNPMLPKDAPYNDERFIQAMFSDETVKNKHNSEVIELKPGVFIAGRVVEHKPVSLHPFEKVKDDIKKRLVWEGAAALAKEEGEKKLAELKKSGSDKGFGPSGTVSRTKPNGLPPPVLMNIMKADASKLPTYVGMEIPLRGYIIFRINKTKPVPIPEDEKKTESMRISEMESQKEMLAYIEMLKKKHKAEILKPAKKEDAPKEATK